MPRILAGLVLSVGSAALLVRAANLEETGRTVAGANPWFVFAAVASLAVSLAAKTVRWRNLLPQDPPARAGRLYRILHVSYLLNNLLPVRLGDIARVAVTAREPGMRIGSVISSLVAERLADGVTLLGAFVLISLFLPLPQPYQPWLVVAWSAMAGAVVLALSLSFIRRRSSPLPASPAIPGPSGRVTRRARLRSEAQSFLQGLQRLLNAASVRGVWGWSVLAWLGAFAINYFLMRALTIDAPWTVAVIVTCATNLAMLVPSSPGYVGVFHAAAVVSLLPFGVGTDIALGFAVLAHLVNVLPVSFLGIAFLAIDRETLAFSRAALAEQAQPADRAA